MKSTFTKALKSEINIVPIDLRLEEPQQMEAINSIYHQQHGKKVNIKKSAPSTHLGHQPKQLLTVISKHQKISINVIQILSKIPSSMEIFYIPNLYVTIRTKFSKGEDAKNYIKAILQNVATNTMMIFTDDSAQGNPGSTGSDVVIKNPGHRNLPIKLAKAITSSGTSYEGEIEAIKLGTGNAFENIVQANSVFIYTDSQSAIKAIMAQSRESYHNETIPKIRDNFIQISSFVEHIKLIYCPPLKGIKKNEIADNLAKTASKEASHLPP